MISVDSKLDWTGVYQLSCSWIFVPEKLPGKARSHLLSISGKTGICSPIWGDNTQNLMYQPTILFSKLQERKEVSSKRHKFIMMAKLQVNTETKREKTSMLICLEGRRLTKNRKA